MLETLGFIQFIAPGLFAAGAAAVAIPIVIHLLNKRRFKTITWAAMEFLLAAQRRNARKLKFRRWLLLATRCLALLLLAAALAQLLITNTGFGRVFGENNRAAVIVWDDSYSMGYQQAGGGAESSTFERSRKLILAWLKTVNKSDRVAIVMGGRGEAALVAKPTLDHELLQRLVEKRRLGDAGTDLAGAMGQASAALEEVEKAASVRDVIIVTDGSKSSLGGEASAAGEPMKKAMEKLKTLATSVRVIDLGVETQGNLGIVALHPALPVVVANHEAPFVITVENGSDKAAFGVPVSLLINNRVVHTEKIGKIEAGESRTIVVEPDANLVNPGIYVVEAQIPRDLLPVDDVRRVVIPVLKELPILIVDGSPGDSNTLGSAAFLQAAYAPVIEGKSDSPFAVHVITELELPRTALKDYRAVILSDVVPPDGPTVEALKAFVKDGGCLMFFQGKNTGSATALINRKMGVGPDGLLPASLGAVKKLVTADPADSSNEVKFSTQNSSNPIVQLFAAEKNSGLTTASTNTYIQLAIAPSAEVQHLLDFSDHAPAVIAGKFGRGTVILSATSADTAWTNFPVKPAYVPFLYELMYFGLSREGAEFTLGIGDKLHLLGDAAPAGSWQGPNGASLNVSTGIDQGRAVLTSEPVREAGVYAPPSGTAAVAVNPDANEADIRHVNAGALAGTLGVAAGDIETGSAQLEPTGIKSADLAANSNAGNLGWKILPLALLLFVSESLLARAFSVHR